MRLYLTAKRVYTDYVNRLVAGRFGQHQLRSKVKMLSGKAGKNHSDRDCLPHLSLTSYAYRTGVNASSFGANAVSNDVGPILLLLLRGYVVISSDWETNELAAFGIGSLAAHGVLDGIRATLNFNSSSLSTATNATKVAIHGYSGGGLASGWATQLQPTYAPEINLVAAAFGGLPANLTADGIFLDGTVASG